eukprot:s650_g10.t1
MDGSDPALILQGSPQGSPRGVQAGQAFPAPAAQPGVLPQGNGQMEMVELARLVASAATAAADAARAAAEVSQGGAGGEKKKDLYRLIPKPAVFAPSDREQEVSQCRDWYWSLRQYLVVIDKKFEDDLEYAERSNLIEVDMDLLEEEEQSRGRFLYSLLSTLLQGRLLSLVRNVDKSNGLEAMRQLL